MQAIKIYKTGKGIVIHQGNDFFLSEESDWDKFINRKDLFKKVNEDIKGFNANSDLSQVIVNNLSAPLGGQEIWAAGVTYLRSREARMEESKDAGGRDFYAKVYDANRPELFFKAPAYHTVGSGDVVRIRKDSQWNVPEPELTLFICSQGTIEGYTIGNDMSSRDIEGENPLYLPQAKSYNASSAIGPCLYVSEAPIHPDSLIRLEIQRQAS